MKKETKIMVEILSLLNQLDTPDAIALVERIGKRLRRANSINTAKEVAQFAASKGLKKNVDKYPVNGQLNG